MAITLNGDTGITTPTYNGNTTAEYLVPVTSFKNKLINGQFQIDQRNAGASVSVSGGAYTLDRWNYDPSASLSWYTFQQNGGSVTPPAGFSNYLGITSTGANTPTSGQFSVVAQYIEGFNTADLAFGTANAVAVTLSFWIRSSLTGTFGGALQNSAVNRSYPFTYTISSANTWEKKSITIAGDTSGTWIGATNGVGLRLVFNLGTGSTYQGTAGAWAGADYRSATGATNISATNGATWYVTGVQLEKGSTATSFDYRPYGTELVLCQRYYQKSYAQATVPGTSIGINETIQFSFGTAGSGIIGTFVNFPTTMRADPTLTVYDIAGNSARVTILDTGATSTNNITLNTSNGTQTRMMVRIFGTSAAGMCFMYQVSAEL
jgi:hypothetical protein